MPAPDLEIGVIYTYERELMPRLLETLAASGDGLRLRLILVDNASANGIQEWRHYFADTFSLRNEQRLAYASNLNRIIAVSSAPYLLLLNTDMYFDPASQCLRRMVELMESRPRCGLAGCRVYHPDGTDAYAARRFPTVPVVLARRLGLKGLFRQAVQRHFYAEHAPAETFSCDWVSGCFMFLRRKALLEVGKFDESYGKYFEDVDLCLRMWRAGWQVVYHGAAYCYHFEQRASKKLFSCDAWLHLRAYLRWLRRWGFRPYTSYGNCV